MSSVACRRAYLGRAATGDGTGTTVNDEKSITIRLGCLAAYGLWIATVALLAIGTHMDSVTWQSWGLAGSAMAATATIRNYFVTQNHMLRAAFEYGREQGRTEGPTPLRRT